MQRLAKCFGFQSIHPDVIAVMYFTFLGNVATSIWLYGAWGPYVFNCFGRSNSAVGWLAATNGLFEVCGASFGGYLADKDGGRLRVVAWSLRCGVTAVVVHVAGVLLGWYALLLLGQSLLGVFMGLSLSSVEAWVADIVKSGERDHLYGFKYALETSGPLVGSVVSLGIFAFFGDAWDLPLLRAVVISGLCVHAVAMGLLQWRLWSRESDEPFSCSGDSPSEEAEASATQGGGASAADCWLPTKRRFSCLPALVSVASVPFCVVAHDTILVIGSGFTTMFFSLFMIEDYGASPVMMSVLNGCCGLSTCLAASALGHATSKYGRTPLILAVKCVGILSLVFIITAKNTWVAPLAVMSVAYAVRYGAMNSCTGVTRSLLMDIVPSSQRARWNAVESLQSASWSGTSVVGGYVTDRYGYATSFTITCVFHAIAWVCLAPCIGTDDRVNPRICLHELTPSAPEAIVMDDCPPAPCGDKDASFSVEDDSSGHQ